MKPNSFDFSSLETGYLIELKKAVGTELGRRKLNSRRQFIASLAPSDFDSRDSYNTRAIIENSENLLSIRSNNSLSADDKKKYLPMLIKQDWSHLFYGGDETEKYYVYAHVDPRDRIFVSGNASGGNYGGKPFYIGKGVDRRAFDLKRNQGHGKIIKSILEDGYSETDIVKILFSGLTEAKAFEYESKLIYFFGTVYQQDRIHGQLYNLDVPKTPDFKGPMSKLINRRQHEASIAQTKYQGLPDAA